MDKQKDKPEYTFQWATFGDSEYWMLHRNSIPVNGEDNESEVLKILNDHRPWVPIEEGEPKDCYYEVTTNKGEVTEAKFYSGENKKYWRDLRYSEKIQVTAYRPLARPYKKQP